MEPIELQTHKGPFGSKLSFSWGPPGTPSRNFGTTAVGYKYPGIVPYCLLSL